MKVHQTDLDGVLVIEVQTFRDERGWFTETYSRRKFSDLGINIEFVQDNHSFSSKAGTLRGLHFQKDPHAQTKLIRCSKGAIRDVAVDLRIGSPTYRKWVMVELSSTSMRQMLIPKGFAHGYLTLEENVEVQYKVDRHYCKEFDRCIRFDDPEIDINWSWEGDFHLSEKDAKAPWLNESDCEFCYEASH
jgi:dTDP-4-dehydrorhamnose 3,5-epimerase